MTTGRINQVTTFQFTRYSAAQPSATFPRQEFISLIQNVLNLPVKKPGDRHNPPCSPISHCSDAMLLVVLLQQKSCPSQRTACNQPKKKKLDHGGFSSVLIATRLATSK